MKTPVLVTLLLLSAPVCAVCAPKADPLCKELRAFLASVKPNENRSITLRTFWGVRKEGEQMVFGSKRCEHNGYEPGKNLCEYLMAHSSTEFAGYNAKRMLSCLAPFPPSQNRLDINSGSFSTQFGSDDRGALVDLDLFADKEREEMVLVFKADGY